MKIHRFINLLLLVACSFLLIVSCHHQVTEKKTDISIVNSSKCRVVQHKLGEVCIPFEPQRIIALDPRYILDPLLALNIRPVGSAVYIEQGKVYVPGLSSREIAGIETVGHADQPSLEKILMLKPDLILGIDIQDEKIYSQLSEIAPTVLINYDEIKYSFKENFRSIAQLLDREEKAQEVLDQYQDRVEEIKDRLGSQLHEIEVSAILYYHGGFWAFTKESGFVQILKDIGLRYKAPLGATQLSIEIISEYDADILFIVNGDRQPSSYFIQNPLFSSLSVVQNGRAYLVDPNVWWAYGPIGINRLLDELSKYLLKVAQNA